MSGESQTIPSLTGKLTDLEMQHLKSGIYRHGQIGQVAHDLKLKILVDAEYTYMNPWINTLGLAMMILYNDPIPLIGNTFQSYLKSSHHDLQNEIAIASKLGFNFACKVVRGAYMEKEKKWAKLHDNPDPINPSYESTSAKYEQNMEHMINYASQNPIKSYFVVASHNEGSIRKGIQLVQDLNTKNVYFAQIYGMGEPITMPLANNGFMVYKSVPFGPVKEVMPYLSRRAAENRVILHGARKELAFGLKSEIKSRLRPF